MQLAILGSVVSVCSMGPSAELRALSTRLLAKSVELRRAAGIARKRGIDRSEWAQTARTRAEMCRIYAEAAVSVRRDGTLRPPSGNSPGGIDRTLSLSQQSLVVSEAVTPVRVDDVAVRLRELYHKNDIARAVFDDAAERRYVVTKTSIDRIARIAGTTRAKAGDLCMLLDVIGVATLKQAKRTGDYKIPTRIHWRYVPRSVGLVAKGAEDTLQDIELDEVGGVPKDAITSNGADHPGGNRFIEHQYPLSEGRIATLRLPIDLTKGEVDRLSRFMAALARD
jgi:hypothetical protein